MKEKDNLTIYEKLIRSRIFFVFLIPISLALLVGIFQQFYYRYQVKKDLDRLDTEIANFNKQKEDLNNLLDYYKNESNLENEARVRLNLKKEGENVVIILPTRLQPRVIKYPRKEILKICQITNNGGIIFSAIG